MTKSKANSIEKTAISNEEINLLPLGAYEGNIELITNPKELPAAFKEIQKQKIVGFDTETRPSFKKGQVYDVSLVQLALEKKVFVIRLNHTGVTEEMLPFFENKKIIKPGIGIRDDVRLLQKLQRFQAEGFFELTNLSKEVGFEVESVKKLTALLLGFRISKSAQTSNWEAETLTDKQLQYAATDAWVCLQIYQRLIKLKSK
jgi:ribonuclease D